MIQKLGQYQIREFLGRGAMGEVYLAHHPVLGREVAIKTLANLGHHGIEALDRFRREASAAARLNHPNIVTIFDFAEADGIPFLVMELMKGEDFKTVLESQSPRPSQCLEVLAQVCEGLDHAHRQGVIHRDIKPSNIRVINDHGRIQAKIMDFGIAKMDDFGHTATGLLMGTAAYLAPECIKGSPATPQSDLFAVGVMLYECLSGQHPFAGESNAHTLFRITTEQPPPLDTKAMEDIHSRIGLVLIKALAKNPAERFPDGHAFSKAIRGCLESELIPEAPPVVNRQPLRWISGVSAILLILAMSGGLALRGRRNTESVLPQPPAPVSTPQAGPRPASQPLPEPVRGVPLFPNQAHREPTASAVENASVQPTPSQEQPVTAKASPQNPPPVQAEESSEDRFTRAKELLHIDAVQAARLLRTLVLAHPEDVQCQGTFLAALYFGKESANFDQALASAKAAGVKVKELIRVPSFRSALQEETRLRRDRSLPSVLSKDTYAKILAEITQEEPPPAGVPRENRP